MRAIRDAIGASLRLKVLLGILTVMLVVEVLNLSTLNSRLEAQFRAEHAAQSAIVADTAAELLTRPLWEFNFPVLRSMVAGLASEPGVVFVTLRSPDAELLAEAGDVTVPSLMADRDLVMSPEFGGETIGTLQIGFDQSSIRTKVAANLRRAAILSVAKMLLVLIPVVLLADHLVQPLGQLAAATRRVRGGDLKSVIPFGHRKDEVGALAGALDALRVAQGEVAAHQAEQNAATKAERQRMLRALSATSDGVIVLNRDGEVTFKNTRASELLGAEDPATILPQTTAGAKKERTIRLAVQGSEETRDVLVRSDPILDQGGALLGRVLLATDTTEQVRARESAEHAARHDPLTGLPNRRAMEERLREMLADTPAEIALLVADLDRFKAVNDGMGHMVGDDLLRDVAALMAGVAGPSDMPLRFGGDEFAILAAGPDAYDRLSGYATALQDGVATPLGGARGAVKTSFSLGIAGLNDADETNLAQTLLKRADLALYDAKARGGNMLVHFRPELEERATARDRIEAALRHSLESGEGLTAVYQPQTNVRTREVTGFETLARLVDENGLPIKPTEFIASAEETGLIVPLTEVILRKAMTFARRLAVSGFPGRVAVNISPRLFACDLGAMLDAALADTGCPPGLIELELTEQTILAEDLDPAGQIEALRARGFVMVLDDFGVGYSSFNYLQRFSFDKIKIDRSFAVQAKDSPKARAIILAITQIGHALGAQVVAEGIETADHFSVVEQARIDTVQGWIDGKPRESTDLDPVLEAPEWWCDPKWLEPA